MNNTEQDEELNYKVSNTSRYYRNILCHSRFCSVSRSRCAVRTSDILEVSGSFNKITYILSIELGTYQILVV